jgi:hypothetical protein
MVDPTTTYICRCGTRVHVNQLGQHHHDDCEFDALEPDCCDQPHVRQIFYGFPRAGTYCAECGERWPGDTEPYVTGLSSHLTDWREADVYGKTIRVRGEVCVTIRRMLWRLHDEHSA